MTTRVVELYEALTQAGVDEETAKKAARAVSSIESMESLATTHDMERLRLELEGKMEAMKTDIIKWNTGTLLAATGIFALIVKLFA